MFFTQTLECETCPQTKQILDELPPLSDKIAIEEVNLILDSDRARQSQASIGFPPSRLNTADHQGASDDHRGAQGAEGAQWTNFRK